MPLDQLPLLPRPRRIASTAGVCAGSEMRSRIDPALPPQGYRLTLATDGISVDAADAAGAHYAAMTLRQLRRAAGGGLPCGVIEDAPDFPVRGVMLDVSRDRVPTMDTLFALVDELAEWKINHLELYTEHTFAYRRHRDVWQYADPLTAEEIQALDRHCRSRFIDLTPNQNAFGHMTRWLKHPRYRDLAETPEGHRAWGAWRPYPASLNPLDPRSLALVAELFAELLPNFTSTGFNVGCDETVDLGQGRSQAACAALGKGRVYLEFLLKIHALVRSHGRTMHFWGDIILHHPELIPELPPDLVGLVWGYEADHPFDRECAAFAAAGRPFFVCPGTSTWNALTGRTDNMLGNLRNAAEHGLRHGARGFLVTDWGDNGHWQPWPFSYPGFAAGAAYAWCYAANRDADLARQLDLHVFHDDAGVMGRIVLDLGNVYRALPEPRVNGTHLFWFLRADEIGPLLEKTTAADLAAAQAARRAAVAPLVQAQSRRPDAQRLYREVALGNWLSDVALRRAACHLAKGMNTLDGDELSRLVDCMRGTWRDRYRPGGLDDSLAPLLRHVARSMHTL